MLKNKIRTIVIITLILLILSAQVISAKTLSLSGITITVDAGHGGRDPGTTYGKIYEKDINLEIAKKLEQELTKNGATVYMTRTADVDLSSIYDSKKKRGDLYRRLLLIKKNNSDLYISIHINWYNNPSYKGAEVLYNPINENNKILAECIMKEFQNELNSNRTVKKTDLYMYRNTTVPGVLVETGYLSNYSERTQLLNPEYQEKLSKTITAGIKSYLKEVNTFKHL